MNKKNKKQYIAPEAEVLVIEAAEILTASTFYGDEDDISTWANS